MMSCRLCRAHAGGGSSHMRSMPAADHPACDQLRRRIIVRGSSCAGAALSAPPLRRTPPVYLRARAVPSAAAVDKLTAAAPRDLPPFRPSPRCIAWGRISPRPLLSHRGCAASAVWGWGLGRGTGAALWLLRTLRPCHVQRLCCCGPLDRAASEDEQISETFKHVSGRAH